MKILFIGDISGSMGRKAVIKILPKLRKEEKIDLVIANVENSAHGSGATHSTIEELMDAGVDHMTMGDHAFSRFKIMDIYEKYPIIRPANFSKDLPGDGYTIIPYKNKKNILLINLIGRVFMKMNYDCPFHKIDEILANIDLQEKNVFAIIIDIHGECTSEKVAFKHYVKDRISAVFGTHTHIMTADHEITPEGMAYITDVGMVGYADGSLGIDNDGIIKTFLTQIKYPHVLPKKGRSIFNSVLISISEKDGKAKSIKPITKFIEIT